MTGRPRTGTDFPRRGRGTLARLTAVAAALAVMVAGVACTPRERPAGRPEKVTIAVAATTESVLVEVALRRGFFREEGLEVTARPHPYGRPCLEDLLAGNADLATVAETPIVFAVLRGEPVAIVATIESSRQGNAILARRDRGIASLADLRGKRVGVTAGTVSDFFLDALLASGGISRRQLAIVDLGADRMEQALESGAIDAASTFNPYTCRAIRKLGRRIVLFQDQDLYTWTFNLVAKKRFIRDHPERVRRVLRALLRAERFVRENPAAAQEDVAAFSGVAIGVVRDIWGGTRFGLSLDQALVLALEDESRWAIRHGLTAAREIPNYLDSIASDGLREVRPEAVRILR